MKKNKPGGISRRLLDWHRRHGRRNLPWQRTRDPYPIWVSEIMLQQTRVETVIPYFERFLARFPDIEALATAQTDAVLGLWTGLGYYARARHLHRAARLIVAEHGGVFPKDFDQVAALPGIGRSTAGAILAFAFGRRHPILDCNVKRVLARYHAVEGWPGRREVEQRLWALAERHTPRTRVAAYTQAIMDLGATVCRRARPGCPACPLRGHCRARRRGNPEAYPAPRPRAALPQRAVTLLMIRDPRGRVLLQRRPPAGLWGGLWGFPECEGPDPQEWCRRALGLEIETGPPWPVLRHSFSHFRLHITPLPARILRPSAAIMENPPTVWYNLQRPDERGFAAPVQHLLQRLRSQT